MSLSQQEHNKRGRGFRGGLQQNIHHFSRCVFSVLMYQMSA